MSEEEERRRGEISIDLGFGELLKGVGNIIDFSLGMAGLGRGPQPEEEEPSGPQRPGRRRGRQKGISIDLGLGELFKGIGNIIDLVSSMADMVDWSEIDLEKLEELRRASQTKAGARPRGVYGFSVRSMGGIPRVQPFGNIRRTERGPIIDEVREPLVDVFDEEDVVLVVAELPGVEEGDIQTEVEGETLNLSTTTKGRRYAKEIELPCAVDESKMESTYKNGVLEIELPKIGSK